MKNNFITNQFEEAIGNLSLPHAEREVKTKSNLFKGFMLNKLLLLAMFLAFGGQSVFAQTSASITFCVDLSCVLPATAPTIFGAFNGWNAGANPVTDPDGDGIYCTTINMPAGAQEYLFFTQQQGAEGITPGSPCTVTTGPFTNRVINVVAGVPQTVTFGWESCTATCSAPPVPNVTICADFTCVPGYDAPRMVVDGMGVVNLNTNAGNNIRCATLTVTPGSQISYYFQYSIPGSAPAENLSSLIGQTCVNAGGTRRVLTAPSAPQTFTYAWESCSATPNCPAPINVTICGDFSCQSGYENPRMIVDGIPGVFNLNTNAGNNVRCATLSLIPGSQISYFFQYSIPGSAPAENLTSLIGQTCVNAGGTRRVLTVPSTAQTFTYAWERCSATQVCPAPTVAAPEPICAQANVRSVYSDTYTNIAGTNFNPNWGQSGFTSATTFTLSGNQMRYYPNMNYQGIALGVHQRIDSFQTLRLDIWSANCSSIDIYLVATTGVERAIRRSLTLDSWNSINIALADYVALGIPSNAVIKEFKFVAINPPNGANIYVDNIYFAKINCTDVTPPTITCSNLTVTFNGESSIPLTASQLATATDDFGTAILSINTSSVTCIQVGQSVPVIVTAMDATGNVATSTCNVTVAGLPCGWSQNANGVGCTDGNSVVFNAPAGIWTVTSTNCYYAPPFSSDSHAFAQRQLCGNNGSIIVRIDNINGQGWAGIVMRETNAPGSKKAQLMTNLSSFIRREFRSITGAQAYPQQIPSINHRWLRITRTGNQFQMFTSLNGTTWQFAGAQNIVMANCIQVGLMLTNFNANSTVSATFSQLVVDGSNVPLGLPGGGVAELAPDLLPLTPDFSVFPNPTSGELNLDLTQYIGRSVRIETYSLEGKLLRFTEVDEVQTTLERLDLKAFQNGMYLVKLKSAGLPDATRRIVLQRE